MGAELLSYRLNVGIALFNAEGRVLIAKRLHDEGPEVIYPGYEWQMPQGGIDPEDDPRAAALRELWEETGIRSAEYLGETAEWLSYDFPPYAGPRIGSAVFGGSAKNGSLCVLPVRRLRSTSLAFMPMRRNRSSASGAGSASNASSSWSFRFGAPFMRKWLRNSPNSPRRDLRTASHALASR